MSKQNGGPAALQISFELTGPNDIDGNTPATPDYTCSIPATESKCFMGYIGGKVGTDTIRGWVQESAGTLPDADEPRDETTPPGGLLAEPDDTDVVEKTWTASAAMLLDCDDQSGDDAETNPSNAGAQSNESYSCRVGDVGDNPVTGAQVFGENKAGPNDADDGYSPASPDYGPCTTAADGRCSITVNQSETQTGMAQICFWTGTAAEGQTLCDDETSTTEGENNDRADQVDKTWSSAAASGLDAEPENDTNELTQNHVITGFVFDQFGQSFVANTTVNFEFFQGSPTDSDGNTPASPDRTCQTQTTQGQTTTNQSNCALTYTQLSTTGVDRVCVWVGTAPTLTGNNTNGTCRGTENVEEPAVESDDAANQADAPIPANDNVDVVTKTWVQPPNPTAATRLDCEPETDTNPTQTSHTISCTATNAQGSRVAGAGIDAEATGTNDPDNGDSKASPDFFCTTAIDDPNTTGVNEAGICSFTHGPAGRGTTNSAGTTTYRAWIDVDANNGTSEADNTEGRDSTTTPGSAAEPDGTDVMEKSWLSDPTTIQMTPESDFAVVGECNAFTILAKDFDGKVVSGYVLDIEQRHTTSTDAIPGNEPTVSFCLPAEGPNRSLVNDQLGDLRPPDENPDNLGTAGGETAVSTDATGQVTIGIKIAPGQGSDGSGTVSVIAFYDPNNDDDPSVGEPSDTSTKTWTAVAAGGRTIDCLPDAAVTPTSEDHTVTCTVRDSSGTPQQGLAVTFSETGEGDLASQAQANTDANGRATGTVSSDNPGQQTITGTISNSAQNEPDVDECDRPAGDPQGAPAGDCADSAQNTWVDEGDPECADGADNDGDGEIDFPDDPDCADADDDDESTSDTKCPGFENVEGNHIVGTNGDDTIVGSSGDDVICGLDGDDDITGLGGDDLIVGGNGNDAIGGGDGSDDIKGGNGKDSLKGDADNDDVRGGAGNDVASGGAGNDTLLGQVGNDTVKGGAGTDFLGGSAGKDKLGGGGGDDAVNGGAGRDTLTGSRGNDELKGGGGNDSCNGGPGRDRCLGGPGKDKIKRCETGDKNTRRKQLVR